MAEINRLDQKQFVEEIGWVFEHSPWVAERAWPLRPFQSLDHLCAQMNHAVETASPDEQIALLRAHPDLGTRARISAGSSEEQAQAGLNQLTSEEYEILMRLNDSYRDRFGFPFILAVKGSGKAAILEALSRRLQSSGEDEFREALKQVFRIARFRLESIVEP